MIESSHQQGSLRLDLLGYTRDQFESLLLELGEKPYRTPQIMKWLHHRDAVDFSQMTDISKPLRTKLAAIAEIHEPEVADEKRSTDGTRKWLMKARSGSLFEMVFIPEGPRGTLCVSSQVGCALDCSFCATGKQGFNSNLTAGEIVGQLRVAQRLLAPDYPDRQRVVTNVVLMGMGEPLLNLDNVIPAVAVMMDDLGYGISKRKVTISTAGVVPGIQRLCETTDASLAISLHAPNDELRNELVPINRKYPIAELLAICRQYANNLGEKRTITVEYILIDKVNDQAEHALQLIELLRDFPCKINLIPFNPFPGTTYKTPKRQAVRAFQDKLVDAGYATMVRTTRGQDIQAACGQLVGEVADRTRRQERYQRIAAGVA
ncbi:MAG: 23S rRNA (adenine(2503)-C(2))-methyltransferase RlmN [Proteobacteria bacterium]|nr:23S rRNA (adenine(2503)-C(2))-methyltransferase RlmN [Pseudomonadota bacterium]